MESTCRVAEIWDLLDFYFFTYLICIYFFKLNCCNKLAVVTIIFKAELFQAALSSSVGQLAVRLCENCNDTNISDETNFVITENFMWKIVIKKKNWAKMKKEHWSKRLSDEKIGFNKLWLTKFCEEKKKNSNEKSFDEKIGGIKI